MASRFEDPYLQSVLEKTAEEEVFRKPQYLISPGSKPGVNYIGRIYRVLISESDKTQTTKSLSLIFKASPSSKIIQEKTTSSNLFRREVTVYQTVLPTLNQLLNNYGVVKSEIFPGTAKFYSASLENEFCNVVVLEDKIADGFCTTGDEKCFNAESCRQVLKKLALWHASSLALQYRDPESAERIKNFLGAPVLFNDIKCPIMDELKENAFVGLRNFLQHPYKEGNGNKTYEKLEKFIQNFHEEILGASEIFSDLYCVIQGDCWFNNVLYKHKDGSLQDVCIIDHQATRLGSPAIDLHFVLLLCTTKKVRDESYDGLIQLYHDEVTSHLRKMDCDPEIIFSRELLQNHLKRCGRIGVLLALAFNHFDLADGSEQKLIGQTTDQEEMVFRKATCDERKRKEISKINTDIVEDALRWGYI